MHLAVKAKTVNRLKYKRRGLRLIFRTDKPSYQRRRMYNPSYFEKTGKRYFCLLTIIGRNNGLPPPNMWTDNP